MTNLSFIQNQQPLLLATFTEFKIMIRNQLVEQSSISNGAWRKLLDQAGEQFIRLTGKGKCLDLETDLLLRDIAYANKQAEYQLEFSDHTMLSGCFAIRFYERTSRVGVVESFEIVMESSGLVSSG